MNTHTVDITRTTTPYTVVTASNTGYGERKTRKQTTYGYICRDCDKRYDAYEGASTRTDARTIAKEDHDWVPIVLAKEV